MRGVSPQIIVNLRDNNIVRRLSAAWRAVQVYAIMMNMKENNAVKFISAVPKMAASNISNAIEFYEQKLGFTKLFALDDYGSVQRGAVEIHFWLCDDRHIAENTACLIQAENIEILYEECKATDIVHPNGLLATQPWGKKDFSVLDLDGNLITFFEPVK